MPREQMPVKMGIEIEYLVFDRAGKGVASGYSDSEGKTLGRRIMTAAASSIQRGIPEGTDGTHSVVYEFRDGSKILPDTFTLLETVTAPSQDLAELRDQLWKLKKALIVAASEQGCHVSGSACPVSYKYEDFTQSDNATFNNAGMHIHFESVDDRYRTKFVNIVTQLVPEMVALFANSSVYDRASAGVMSQRLKTSKLASASVLEPLEYDPGEPLQNDDPNKRYRFVTAFTKKFKTVELRGIDTPISIDWAMAIAALLQALMAKSEELFVDSKRNTPMSQVKRFRQGNFEAAVRSGLEADLRVDHSFKVSRAGRGDMGVGFLHHDPALKGKTVPAKLAAKRLLYFVEDQVERLGLREWMKPLYDAVSTGDNQAALQLKWLESGYDSFQKKLLTEARKAPITCEYRRSGRHYFAARQRSSTCRDGEVGLSGGGLRRLGINDGASVVVSGPLGSVTLKARKDDRGATLPLQDNEVGIGAATRARLGVSLLDPVIIGDKPETPLVTELCGKEWFSAPPPKKATYTVQKGVQEHGVGVATVSAATATRLGVTDGDAVTVVGDSGGEHTVTVKVGGARLRDDVVCLMAKDRLALGAEVGAEVRLQKGGAPRPVPTDTTYKVRQGIRVNGVGVATISAGAAERLGVEEGDSLTVASEGGNEHAVTVKIADGELPDSAVCLMAKDRDALGIEVGADVRLRKAGAPPPVPAPDRDGLVVIKGAKDDPDSPVVVRVNPDTLKSLGLSEGDKVDVGVFEGGDKQRRGSAVVKASNSVRAGQVGVREKARKSFEVETGDRLWIEKSGGGGGGGDAAEFIVVQGDRADGDETPVARLHAAAMASMGVQEGDEVVVGTTKDGTRTELGRATVKARQGGDRNRVGLRKAARKAFGLDEGDRVWIQAGGGGSNDDREDDDDAADDDVTEDIADESDDEEWD